MKTILLDLLFGKESTCNAGDPSSIPGSRRSTEEGIGYPLQCSWASLVAQLVKNPPAMIDLGSIPGLGRSPGERKDYPLQYSDLEHSMNCIVHGVTKSQKRLSNFHFHLGWSSRCCFHNSMLLLVSLHSKAVLVFRCISAFPSDTRYSEDLCH